MRVYQHFKKLFDPIDLTKGSIWKDLLRFVIPIILSMLFQEIYTLTDAMIVGQSLSESEIAGVNNSSALIFLVLKFGFGCAAGFSAIIAEAIGKKDGKGIRESFLIQFVLCAIVSIVLALVGILCLPWLLQCLGIVNSTSDPEMAKIYEAAYTYIAIIYAGVFAQIFYNMIVANLRAMGDSFVPFLFLFGSTILNIGLDCLFIMVFHWGVAGSAIATILSQGLAALGAIIYAWIQFPVLRFKKKDWAIPFSSYWRHIKNGFPLGFQFSVLAIGLIVMQSSIISFDIDPSGKMLANMPAQLGYGAACKIINLLEVPFTSLGAALLAFTGQNLGSKDGKRIKDGFKISFFLGLIFWGICLIIGLCLTINGFYQHFFLASNKISQESINYGNLYLYLSVPSLVILMFLFLVRNTLQGLQKPLWPFLSGVGELLARVLICSFVPSLIAGGPINSSVGLLPFFGAILGDPGAWLISPLISLVPMIMAFSKLPMKEEKALPSRLDKEVSISQTK